MLPCPSKYCRIASNVCTHMKGKLYTKAHSLQIRTYPYVYIRIQEQSFKGWKPR